MKELTLKQFEELNLFSNRNLEKIVASIVNESSNASFVAMWEDVVLMLDHDEGKFYSADYKFDKEKMALTLENFEDIKLKKESVDFKESVKTFFDSSSSDISQMAESYQDNVASQEKYLNEVINEAMSMRDFSGVDYKQLAEANDDCELKNSSFFKKYLNRIETNPLNEVKYFNFKDPVVVSLVESERFDLVNSSIIEKAHELWKKEGFKQMFAESAKTLLDDVDAGKEMLAECFKTYPQIFYLDKADRKALIGKTILGSSAVLRENIEALSKGIEVLITEDEDISSIGEAYLAESGEDEEENQAPEDKKEKAPELTPEEIAKLASELKRVAGKIEDEKVKEEVLGIAEKLHESIEEGTRVSLVKQAVYFLNI